MEELLTAKQIVPAILSILTFFVMWQVGNKRLLGWILGLISQCFWMAFVLIFQAWGLSGLVVGLTIIYSRNLRRWIKEHKRETDISDNEEKRHVIHAGDRSS